MLVQFRIKNFMSIRDEQVFSLVAVKGLREKDEQLRDNIIIVSDQFDLVKTAVIYGANASGKSNLLRAMDFFFNTITDSPQSNSSIGLYSPFILDPDYEGKPTLLEAVFVINQTTYRYGFEILKQAIVSEWLFIQRKQESYVFERAGNELRVNRPYKKLHELQSKDMIGQSVFLLRVGALFNDETCLSIVRWADDVRSIEGTDDYKFEGYTIQYLEKPEYKQRILDLLRSADLGIEDIELIPYESKGIVVPPIKFYGGGEAYPVDKSKDMYWQGPIRKKNYATPESNYHSINSKRKIWDTASNQFITVSRPLKTFESQGTKKFFNLIGLIISYLDNGGILIADELDTKLHPLLTHRIVQLFNNSITNKKNAQFIFATHDTNLLNAEGSVVRLFRRDQIWFTEKDNTGATQLYALTDYKPGGRSVRNDEQLEKNYIAGKYGGIPYLGNFDALFEPKSSADEAVVHE
ncbi:MAG: putative abortive infection protein [Spirosoma sp.]|nr:putative abortive infection protein [Spirosoma sp.]